jgi:hypothetical protein
MRWTNYFVHPADNRYMVFTFRTEEQATAFRTALEEHGIPFEFHQESEPGRATEWMFGVHRDHKERAMQLNFLLIARTRQPFVPHRGLRWFMLAITGGAIVLGLLGYCNRAAAQSSGGPPAKVWELDVLFQYHPMVPAVGTDVLSATEGPLSLELIPTGGTGAGMRIQHNFRKSWTLSTGLQYHRLWSDWALTFVPDSLAPEVRIQDTLRLRTLRYRIPLVAGVRVPISTTQHLLAGAGLALDLQPSDVYTAGSQLRDSTFHDFSAAINRTRWWSTPMMVELGWSWTSPRTSSTFRSVYLGGVLSRTLGTTHWGEANWTQRDTAGRVRLWLGDTVAAIELRLGLH